MYGIGNFIRELGSNNSSTKGTKMKKILLLLMLMCTYGQLFAQRKMGSLQLGEIQLNHIMWGHKTAIKFKENHIIAVPCWDIEEEHCRAKMPQLNRLFHKYHKRGLIMFSLYMGKPNLADVWKFAKKYKIPYPIYRSYFTLPRNALPYLLIFNSKGKIAYHGSPDNGEKAVRELLKTEPHWLLGDRKFIKLRKEAYAIRRNKKLGRIYLALKKKLDNTEDETTREEAEYLIKCIEKYMFQELDKIKLQRKDAPELWLKTYKNTINLFYGHPEIKRAKKDYKLTKKSKHFKDLHRAAKIYEKAQSMIFDLKPASYGEKIDLSDAKCRKKNASALRKIYYLCTILEKKYPTTPFYNALKGWHENYKKYVR